ncbi:MAG TPA: hypothetical protein DHW63_07170 [Hyphomonadaceae bacterium]|nr:hypothetical protein [Hyphomonadaceae bacterium]
MALPSGRGSAGADRRLAGIRTGHRDRHDEGRIWGEPRGRRSGVGAGAARSVDPAPYSGRIAGGDFRLRRSGRIAPRRRRSVAASRAGRHSRANRDFVGSRGATPVDCPVLPRRDRRIERWQLRPIGAAPPRRSANRRTAIPRGSGQTALVRRTRGLSCPCRRRAAADEFARRGNRHPGADRRPAADGRNCGLSGGGMRFTVLIPTNDHGELIRNAIRSVLRQTVAGWNLVVVGDGAPPEMAAIVEQEAQGDNRIGYRAFPKGERHGEAWRHEVLRDATGDAVAYLGDDDFWLPDHLATLGDLLAGADLAHTRQTEIRPDGMIFFLAGSLSNDSDRRRLLLDPPWNFFGPTVAGHRLDAYRKLPAGWSPAPAGLPTDIYMWRKFLRQPGMRFAGSPMTTAIKLGAAGLVV